MSLKDTEKQSQLALLTNIAHCLSEGHADLHLKVNKLALECDGDYNNGALLQIIDFLISIIMEDGALEFDDVIMLLSGVRAITRIRR